MPLTVTLSFWRDRTLTLSLFVVVFSRLCTIQSQLIPLVCDFDWRRAENVGHEDNFKVLSIETDIFETVQTQIGRP